MPSKPQPTIAKNCATYYLTGGVNLENTNFPGTSAIVPVVTEIRSILDTARNHVAQQVNNELLCAYWNIGRIICEYEQSDSSRADYGKQTLRILSKELTREFGKGFSVSNIQFMRRFYQTYQIQQTVSVKLSWSAKYVSQLLCQ